MSPLKGGKTGHLPLWENNKTSNSINIILLLILCFKVYEIQKCTVVLIMLDLWTTLYVIYYCYHDHITIVIINAFKLCLSGDLKFAYKSNTRVRVLKYDTLILIDIICVFFPKTTDSLQ